MLKHGQITLDEQELNEILEALPEYLRKKFVGMMWQDVSERRIELIKRFVAQFDDKDDVDCIMANTAGSLIERIREAMDTRLQENRENGLKGMCGIEAGHLVQKCLKDESDSIQESMDTHNIGTPN